MPLETKLELGLGDLRLCCFFSEITDQASVLSLPLDRFSFRFPDDDDIAMTVDPEHDDSPARWRFRQSARIAS
jgi:hypothetical protein